MTNEEKFKSSMKALLDEPYYAYDASNWDIASEYLDKEASKRKRRILFILFASLGLGLSLTGYLVFISQNKMNETSQVKTMELPVRVDPEISVGIQRPEKEGKGITKLSSTKEIKNVPAENTHPVKEPAAVNPLSDVSSITETQAESGPLDSDAGITDIPEPLSSFADKIKPTKNKTVEKEKHLSTIIRADITEPSTVTIKDLPSKEKDNSESIVNSGPSETKQEKQTVVEAAPLPEITQKEEEKVEIKSANDLNKSEQPEQASKSLLATRTDSLIKPAPVVQSPDTMVAAAIQPTLQDLPNPNYCYVEAGTYFNFGWKSENKGEGTSLNPYLGLSYLIKPGDKAGFSIGAYYTTVSGFKTTKLIKSSKIIFGEESEVTAITPFRLNYIAVPLKLQYLFGPANLVIIGYTASYLLDVQSKVETYTERMGLQENKTTYHTGGYVQGFKTFNSQVCLGYKRLLYKNLWLNTEFIAGITDVRDNNFFGIQLKERASGIKLSLTYDLLKK